MQKRPHVKRKRWVEASLSGSKSDTKINVKGTEFFYSDTSMTGTKQTFMIWSRVIYGRI